MSVIKLCVMLVDTRCIRGEKTLLGPHGGRNRRSLTGYQANLVWSPRRLPLFPSGRRTVAKSSQFSTQSLMAAVRVAFIRKPPFAGTLFRSLSAVNPFSPSQATSDPRPMSSATEWSGTIIFTPTLMLIYPSHIRY